MKPLNLLLISLVLCSALTSGQKGKHRVTTVTVLDQNKNAPVDSAKVILTSLTNARDLVSEIKFTDPSGHCSFSLDQNPAVQYQISTSKNGLISYFDDNAVEMVKSSMAITRQTGNKIVLYLTSDSLNHIRFWSKRTTRYPIDTLIRLLKTDSYLARSSFPLLLWEDIPGLLSIGNSNLLITHFPISVLSSSYMKDCYLGIVALWFIESARITIQGKITDPDRKFPSQTPSLRYSDDPGMPPNTPEIMEKAYKAYNTWWEKVQNTTPESGCKVNPLESTGLMWR